VHADALPSFARTDLERLRLAADVILRLGGDGVIPAPLEVLDGTQNPDEVRF
jgi:hypothetical protein